QVTYDEARQRVSLLVPVTLLEGQPARLGLAHEPPPREDPATRLRGLTLNYDLYGQHDGDHASASAWSELRLFGVGRGVFVNTGNARAYRSDDAGDGYEAVRLASFWEYDDPER